MAFFPLKHNNAHKDEVEIQAKSVLAVAAALKG